MIIFALQSLRPGAEWALRGDSYEDLQWIEPPTWEGGQTKPTREEVELEVERLQKEWEYKEYQRLRAPEYPDFKEYLDGLVKGDSAQMQSYIDKCLEVKSKYPKPEGVE
jgi:hypothetical protein